MGPRHWLNLEGAQAINTESMKLTIKCVQELVQRNAMGAFHGRSGLGKSFAIAYAAALMAKRRGVVHHTVTLGERPSQTDMLVALLDELTGRENNGKRRHLIRDLIAVLSDRPRLLILDEAQSLHKACFETIRHVHDDARTQFALAFVGGNGAWGVLSQYPMLRNRIHRRVAFEKLTSEQVIAHLPKYHPLYERTEPDVLLYVDDYYAHGHFRDWADFTVSAKDICEAGELDAVTIDVAKAVFALKGGALERDAA